MVEKLNKDDLNFILESLQYTKLNFENYSYPSYEIKQKRIEEVLNVIIKVEEIKKSL